MVSSGERARVRGFRSTQSPFGPQRNASCLSVQHGRARHSKALTASATPIAIITQTKPPDPIHVLPNILRLLICGLLTGSLLNATSTAAEPTRRFIAADSSKNTVAIIDETGKTEWEHKIGPLHDLHVLPNGHVLLQLNWTEVVEINPTNGKIEWRYDAKKRPENAGKPLEIHAFQRLANGNTMVAESGPGC